MPYCPDCGAQNEANAAFCESCGAHLEGEPPPPPSRSPAGQGPRWAALGGLVALMVLAAGAVALYDQVGRDGEWRQRLFGGAEEQKVVAGPSPVVPAAPTPTAVPQPTVAPQPTAVPQPTPPPPPTAVPPAAGYATPEEALRAYIEQYGGRYVGDCALANIQTDVGDFCAALQEDRGQTLIYAAGFTFSEYAVWLLVVNQGGGWLVVEEAKIVPGPDGAIPPW
jgi:hypothetical protein